MTLILEVLDNERRLQLSRNLYIIIAIDTENILYNIAWALYVNTESRNCDVKSFSILLVDLDVERSED